MAVLKRSYNGLKFVLHRKTLVPIPLLHLRENLMLARVLGNLSHCLGRLLVADLVFKAIAFVLLTPLVSLLFRAFIALSGRTVIADTDILMFFIHPTGALAGAVMGSLLVTIAAFELAHLMTVAIAAEKATPVTVRSSLIFVLQSSANIFRMALRVIVELVLFSLPFLAVGGLLFWLLLTDHDINFYLSTKPPKFWLAVGSIGFILATLAFLLVWRLARYFFSIQILLFEQASPQQALALSRERAHDRRTDIAKDLGIWLLINFAIGAMVTLLVGLVGRLLVTNSAENMFLLVLAVGSALGLVAIANLACNAVSNASLASLLAMAYLDWGKHHEEDLVLPEASEQTLLAGVNLTRFRILAFFVIAIIIAGLLGSSVLRSFNIEDSVEITAHRGGATAAPENTMAAVQSAINLKADWLEIDVQESKDGIVVVAHDSDLKKVANNPVKIWEATAEELRQVDIGSYFASEFADQRVPLLKEVLEACRGKIRVNIELKYYGHNQQLEQRVVDLVEQAGMENDIVVMSLKQAGIDKIKELRPEWTCGLLTAVATGDLTKAKADFLAVNANLATKSFVNLAHQRGKSVSAWTLNESIDISRMISRGVDNLITDDVALVHQVLKERSSLTPIDRMLLELAYYFGVDIDPTAQTDS